MNCQTAALGPSLRYVSHDEATALGTKTNSVNDGCRASKLVKATCRKAGIGGRRHRCFAADRTPLLAETVVVETYLVWYHLKHFQYCWANPYEPQHGLRR